MYSQLSNAITEVVKFTNKHQIEAEFHIHTVADLQGDNGIPDEFWARFEMFAGVYIFFDNEHGAVHYVGMSECSTGTRVAKWLFEENKVSEALADTDLILSVVLAEESYMAPALESYLISKMSPKLNARGKS